MTAKWVLAITCTLGMLASGREGFAQFATYPAYANGYGSYGWGYGGYGLGYSLGYGYGLNYAGYGGFYSPYAWGYGYPYGYGYGMGGYGYGMGGFGYGYPYGYGFGGYPFGYGFGGYYPYGLGFGGLYGSYGFGFAGGYGGFGYPWGFFFPSYFNYVQPSLANPIAGQPAYSNSDYVARSPVFATPQFDASLPTQSTTSSTTIDGGEIVLFSPSSNTATVQYKLNGMTYTMKPGSVQKFSNDRSWVVEVSDGAGQLLTYALQSGTYKFKQSNATFGLYTSDDRPNANAPALNAPETVPPRPSEGTAVPAPAPNIP